MLKNGQKKNGITLIALIITIIVILILVAVTVAAVIKEDGLFKNAAKSRILKELTRSRRSCQCDICRVGN